MRLLVISVGLFVLIGGGCSSTSDRPGGIDAPAGGFVPSHSNGEDYPDGPYSRGDPEVGDVIEDLTLLGHLGIPGQVTETDDELDRLTFSELRETEATYLLIHTSATWCATCRVEALYLSEYTQAIAEEGGTVLELVVDGQATGFDPSKEELDVWVKLSDLQVSTMGPGDDNLRKVFPSRDHVYIVDLETMEVVWRIDGPKDGRAASEIGALELLTRYLAD